MDASNSYVNKILDNDLISCCGLNYKLIWIFQTTVFSILLGTVTEDL